MNRFIQPAVRWLLIGTLPMLLIACHSSQPGAQACAHEVSRSMDTGQWQQALEQIDSPECRRGMSQEGRALNRAAAYIGRAGYELTDLIEVVLSEPLPDEDNPDLRFIRRLGSLGVSPGALRDLDLSLLSHQSVVSKNNGDGASLLQQACLPGNIDQLSDTEKDACFLAGLFAPARFAKALTLMLGQEAPAWQDDDALTCETDLNNSGVIDGAQVTACALTAIGEDNSTGDVCVPGSSVTGEVRWERLTDVSEVQFEIDGQVFGALSPVRVIIEPGPACTGRESRVRYRFIVPGSDPSMAVTDGYCRRDVRDRCSAAAPGSGCWPCPIPRADGTDLLTLSNTLLSPLNREAELMLFVLPNVESDRVAQRLESTRQSLCEPAEGTPEACDLREDGATLVRQSALEAYFEQ
ncbi:hypothetical protein [Saccharospirillum salsuginis]|uniref:Uncharacterized protein n=1 Tax=Saccharospirillum salsuginis TaxID=418750 RepID=A0A918N7N2_9GAMM|nr:hypothetical protein [Saccharospirillum salsuginis]GGX44064.1 hypothetical protein GCM10007392_08540 [Saccharospirillum salsuginis]